MCARTRAATGSPVAVCAAMWPAFDAASATLSVAIAPETRNARSISTLHTRINADSARPLYDVAGQGPLLPMPSGSVRRGLTSDRPSAHADGGADPRPTSRGPAPAGTRCEAKGGILPDSHRLQPLRHHVRAAGE